jgi:restriction endonuclease Mrr
LDEQEQIMAVPFNDLINRTIAENPLVVGEIIGYVNLKAMWLVYVRPDLPQSERNERYQKELEKCLTRFLERKLIFKEDKTPVDTMDALTKGLVDAQLRYVIALYVSSFMKETTPEVFCNLADRRVFPSFYDLVSRIEEFASSPAAESFKGPHEEPALLGMASVIQRVKETLIPLSRSEVAALKTLTNELMMFLQADPDAIRRMHWQAFQELVWEKFACDGYHVKDVSRIRNSGGDLVAIQQEGGKEVRHLVEAKRREEKIGMEIFNQVVGAADNTESEHVFLVTSSEFTADVLAAAQERERLSQQRERNAKFKNVVVELVDGKRLAEWLSQYKVRTDGGLWLRETWQM